MGDRSYNREYARKLYDEFRASKDEISLNLFGGKCFLCEKTEGFEHYHLHHVVYDPTDSSYRRRSKAQWTRKLRLVEAIAHPERFRLLCDSCHRLVTSVGTYLVQRLEIHPDVDFDNFVDLAIRETINRLKYIGQEEQPTE